MFGQLASWGFVVFASSYRASFNNELNDEFGGSDVDDILNLMEIAKEIPFADTSRWAMEGWSRGGMMTYLALRKRHDVKAAIISGGITDVAECCLNVPRIREALQQLVEIEGIGVYEKRSAIHFADELPKDCKYLIIHGTKDETVSPLQAIKIAEKLLEQRLHFRLVLLEEADHFLKGKKKIVDELRREWLLKYI
ncbi:MAG: prolyl oligopeptidase family serine peptidase [Ignavibacteriales bacterium]|nr:prolyl oligopeptidase family serine peptidase [Ignavibacteriales bacterium]